MGRFRRYWLMTLLPLLVVIVWGTGIWQYCQVKYLVTKAQHALRNHEPKLLQEYLTRAARIDPVNSQVVFLQARIARREGQLTRASELLQTALNLGVDPARVRREQWLAMMQMGQFAEAASALFSLLHKGDDEPEEICEALANGFFISFRYAEAFRVLEAWQRDCPNDCQPHVFRGLFAEKQMQWQEAVKHFRNAFQLNPHRRDLELRLANSLVAAGELSDASKHFRRLKDRDDCDASVCLGYGKLLLQLGQFLEARTEFERVVCIDSENSEALAALGQIALALRQTEEAFDYLERAIRIDPSNSQARTSLAHTLQRSGRESEAQVHYRKIAERQELANQLFALEQESMKLPNKIEIRFKIATLYDQLEKPAEKVAWLRSITQIAPREALAYQLLADHFLRTGDLQAAQMYRRELQLRASIPLEGEHRAQPPPESNSSDCGT